MTESVKIKVNLSDEAREAYGFGAETPWATPTDDPYVVVLTNVCFFVPLTVGDKVRIAPQVEEVPGHECNDGSHTTPFDSAWMAVVELVEPVECYMYTARPVAEDADATEWIPKLREYLGPEPKMEGGFGAVSIQSATPVEPPTDQPWFWEEFRSPDTVQDDFAALVDTGVSA